MEHLAPAPEIIMRQLGLIVVLLAAVPAMAVPLLACVALISAPAALIAGIAAISDPPHHDRATGTAPVTDTVQRIVRR